MAWRFVGKSEQALSWCELGDGDCDLSQIGSLQEFEGKEWNSKEIDQGRYRN